MKCSRLLVIHVSTKSVSVFYAVVFVYSTLRQCWQNLAFILRDVNWDCWKDNFSWSNGINARWRQLRCIIWITRETGSLRSKSWEGCMWRWICGQHWRNTITAGEHQFVVCMPLAEEGLSFNNVMLSTKFLFEIGVVILSCRDFVVTAYLVENCRCAWSLFLYIRFCNFPWHFFVNTSVPTRLFIRTVLALRWL